MWHSSNMWTGRKMTVSARYVVHFFHFSHLDCQRTSLTNYSACIARNSVGSNWLWIGSRSQHIHIVHYVYTHIKFNGTCGGCDKNNAKLDLMVRILYRLVTCSSFIDCVSDSSRFQHNWFLLPSRCLCPTERGIVYPLKWKGANRAFLTIAQTKI